MRKLPLIAGASVLVLAAIAGGAYELAVRSGERDLAAATAGIRQAVGPSGRFSYDASAIHPLSRAADLSHVVLRTADGTELTADRLVVSGAGGHHLRALHAEGLRVVQPGRTLQAARFDMDDVTTPGGGPPVDPATVTFAHAKLVREAIDTPRGHIGFETAEVTNYGAGRASAGTLTGGVVTLSGAQAGESAGFDRLHVEGLDVASTVDAIEHGHAARPLAGQHVVSMTGFYAAKDGRQIFRIADAEMSGETTAAQSGWAKGRFTDITSTPTTPAARAGLAAAGLDTIRSDVQVASAYDRAAGTLRIEPMTLRMQGIGTLEVTLDLANVALPAMTAGHPDLRPLAAASLVRLDLRATDAGGLARLFDVRAQKMGIPPANLRAAVVSAMAANPRFATAVPDDAMRADIEKFVGSGGTLDIRLRPAEPTGLMALLAAIQLQPASFASTAGLSSQWSAPSGM